ncbi:MAG: hypothetical protein KDD62_03920, partial [Bdellovibrionales bacterium]|nr:hypothetical protein [Bdellovibrionales bacterium]
TKLRNRRSLSVKQRKRLRKSRRTSSPNAYLELTPVHPSNRDGAEFIRKSDGQKVALPPLSISSFRGYVIEHSKNGKQKRTPIALVRAHQGESTVLLGGGLTQGSTIELISRTRSRTKALVSFKSAPIPSKSLGCGNEHSPSQLSSTSQLSRNLRSGDGQVNVIELAMLHDCRAIENQGGIDGYRLWWAAALNYMNFIYETQLNASLKINYQEFFESCANDPFQSTNYSTVSDLLTATYDYSRNEILPSYPHDAVHILMGREALPENVAGIASWSSVCFSSASASSGVSKAQSRDFLSTAVMMHEIAHNLGALHDSCSASDRSTWKLMCDTAYPSDSFSSKSISDISSGLARSCISQENIPGYGSRPYFDLSSPGHRFEPDDFRVGRAVAYEGFKFRSKIPVYDQNDDIVNIEGIGIPDTFSINTDEKILEIFIPRDCSKNNPDQIGNFALHATDATGLTALNSFFMHAVRKPFIPTIGFHNNFLYPGEQYNLTYVEPEITGADFSYHGNAPLGLEYSLSPPSVLWDPPLSELGQRLRPRFCTSICGDQECVSESIYFLPGKGVPVFKQPYNLVSLSEGQTQNIPLEWIGDEFTSFETTVSPVGELPREVSVVGSYGKSLHIAPDENSVDYCNDERENFKYYSIGRKTISIDIEAYADENHHHVSPLKVEFLDIKQKPVIGIFITDPQLVFREKDLQTVYFYSLLPKEGSPQLKVVSETPNFALDEAAQKITWQPDFSGQSLDPNYGTRAVRGALVLEVCGKEVERADFVFLDGTGNPNIEDFPGAGGDDVSSTDTPHNNPASLRTLLNKLLKKTQLLKRKQASNSYMTSLLLEFEKIAPQVIKSPAISQNLVEKRIRMVKKGTKYFLRFNTLTRSSYRSSKRRCVRILSKLIRTIS